MHLEWGNHQPVRSQGNLAKKILLSCHLTPQKPNQRWTESINGLNTEEGNSFLQDTTHVLPVCDPEVPDVLLSHGETGDLIGEASEL